MKTSLVLGRVRLANVTRLFVAFLMLTGLASAQTLNEYQFTTGVDSAQWHTLSPDATAIWFTYQDDIASSAIDLGFNFTFADSTYQHFSVNSNGVLRLGAEAARSGGSSGMFNTSSCHQNLPKICGITKDMSTGISGGVYYERCGTAPNRMVVVEYRLTPSYSQSVAADVKWQVQLYENGCIQIVYGSTAPSITPANFQTGIAVSESDIVLLDPSTNTPYYYNTPVSATYSTWHGANRYYRFEQPTESCPRPVAIHSITSSPRSHTIAWTDTSDATAWVVRLSSGTFTSFNTSLSTRFTFNWLMPNTTYEVSVAGICANGDTSRYRIYAFSTPCEQISTLPYSNNFEDEPIGSSSVNSPFAACWQRLNNGTHYGGFPYVANHSVYNHTDNGSYGLIWYGSSIASMYGDYLMAVLPQIDTDAIDMGRLQLSFWAKDDGGTCSPTVQVGVMTDPTDASTFRAVDSVVVDSRNWTLYECTTAGLGSPGSYLALRANRAHGNDAFWRIFMDDVTLERMQTCAHATNLAVQQTTPESIRLTWQAEDEQPHGWLIQYGPRGFELNDSSATTLTSSTTACTIANLAPETYYDIYVAATCGNADTSRWERITCHTACTPVADLPYRYGFEDATADGFSPCWTSGSSTADAQRYPALSNDAYEGNYALFFYLTDTAGYQYAALPYIDHPLDSLQLKFKMKRNNPNTFSQLCFNIKVGIMTDPTDIATFTEIGTYTATSNTSWDSYTVYLNNYHGNGYLAFRDANSIYTYWTFVLIDDIEVDYLPSCAPIEHVDIEPQAHEVSLTWTLAPVGLYGGAVVKMEDPASHRSITDTVSGTSCTFTGLIHNHEYEVTISSICPEQDVNPFTARFTTDSCDNHNNINDASDGGNGMLLYPNPAAEYVDIALPGWEESGTVTVVDMSGHTLITKPLPAGVQRMKLDTAQLPKGTYFVRIESGSTSMTKKLIIGNSGANHR